MSTLAWSLSKNITIKEWYRLLSLRQKYRAVCALLLLGFVSTPWVAWSNENSQSAPKQTRSWSLSVDNDILLQQDRDKDYTGGVALTLSGPNTRKIVAPLGFVRRKTEGLLGITRRLNQHSNFRMHSAEAGFILFTPQDITIPEPVFEDHPYASLFFAVSTEQTVLPEKKVSFHSSFTFGLLGLPLAEDVQSGLHDLTGSDQPEGWDNQISAGGEPTARYSFGVQKLVKESQWSEQISSEFKWTSEASAGFTTGVNAGFNFRIGRLTTPWWSFNPHQAEYVNLGNRPTAENRSPEREIFIYMGATTTLRAYNAILQGQFRDSAVQFSASEVRRVIVEGWIGASYEFNRYWAVSVFGRIRTAEVAKSVARSPKWAGFILHRTF